jgi:hypothetical protein
MHAGLLPSQQKGEMLWRALVCVNADAGKHKEKDAALKITTFVL